MEDKIRNAYEEMTPTPEQEDRILAALLEAQEAKAAEAAENAENAGTAGEIEPAKKRTGFSAWKVVAPIAACLVVGAIAIGTGALNNGAVSAVDQPKDTQTTTSAQRTEDANQAPQMMATEAETGMVADSDALVEPSIDIAPIDGDPFNTEEYAAVDENGFIATRTQPLSTVSADVDTASYANVRRMIADGYGLDEIPSGAVRIEEMLNYFTYDYAEPAAGERFSVTTHLGPCPWNPETRLLTLGFATARENTETIRGRNLVFLIDVSGSMDSRDKLDLLKDAFAVLVRSLGRDDRISIVTYASGEELILEGARGDEARTIMRAIDRLEASGSTNGERGLERAYEVA